MDALQETGVRLREHFARCQVRNRRVKLYGPIPSALRAMAGQTPLLVVLLASRQISFSGSEARRRSREPTDHGERAHDMEAVACYRFLFHQTEHSINDRTQANAGRIAESKSRFERATRRPLGWRPAHPHRDSR